MTLPIFTYYNNGKKTKIPVEVCDTIWKKFRGLMFRQTSPALLFLFKKNQTIAIHSFFCKPFRAIWLDDKKRVVKFLEIKNWRPNFSCYGKYLLEIPLSSR
ncbi:DUF192 domain-containing protein [Candidatus Pacearchaeota archaeon]|nr:DUF192 domain-containing protein [Candidatus Pacearchaeota archaeon]